MKKMVCCLAALVFTGTITADIVGFESFSPGGSGYINDASPGTGFIESGVELSNNYNPTWGSWTGFSISNVNDPTTPGWGNQYAVASGTGLGGSGNYGVSYNSSQGDAVISWSNPNQVNGTYVNNTTYAALSMRDGDSFAKQFGGATGDDEDWFLLTIIGKDAGGSSTGMVDFYLADYRFGDNSMDYIVNDWTWVDLTGLGSNVTSLEFQLASTDNGSFGMNTPSYFCTRWTGYRTRTFFVGIVEYWIVPDSEEGIDVQYEACTARFALGAGGVFFTPGLQGRFIPDQ